MTLVAWWKLDEASGSTLDDPIGGYDLTITGTPTTMNAAQVATSSVSGGSIQFGSAYAALTSTPLGAIFNAPFSWAFWFKRDSGSMSNGAIAFGMDTATDRPVHLKNENGYNLFVAMDVGGNRQPVVSLANSEGTFPALNTIWHIVATWDGLTMKVYKNGTFYGLANPNTYPGTFSGNAFKMGQSWGNYLDDVQLFSRVLTPTEVADLYADSSDANTIAPPTAPAFAPRGLATATRVATTSTQNITLPAGSAVGDTAVLYVTTRGAYVATPSGFTDVNQATNTNDSPDIRIKAMIKTLDSTDVSTNGYIAVTPPNTNETQISLTVLTGTAGVVSSTTAQGSNLGDTDILSLTPSSTDQIHVSGFGSINSANSIQFTRPYNPLSNKRGSSGSVCSMVVGHFDRDTVAQTSRFTIPSGTTGTVGVAIVLGTPIAPPGSPAPRRLKRPVNFAAQRRSRF